MIDNTNEMDKGLESALKALEQAKARVANEKKKQNEKKRKAENHHKYMIGGIVAKYFPKCYRFDEQELNQILSAALATRECKQAVENIEKESGGNANIFPAKNVAEGNSHDESTGA